MPNLKFINDNKIIFVPYPAQGHVTPMLKLASAFHSLGFHPVVVTPEFIHRRIVSVIHPDYTCVSIPDGLETNASHDFFTIEKVMENVMPVHLERVVRDFDEDGGVRCLVVDLLASPAIEAGFRCGVAVAGFWPAMVASYQLISAIPDMVRSGFISETGSPQHEGPLCCLPNQPLLSTEDLPWLIGTPAARNARFKFWTRTLDRSKRLQWLLINSFPEEHQIYDTTPLSLKPVLFHVGALSKHALIKNPSIWEEDMSCLQWLDKQKPDTVIYISFGSWVSPIGEGKIRSLAMALEALGQPFIWVLGQKWRDGLPAKYSEMMKHGKVVSWAPQLQVLKHKAVGCYLTHCGWNSTMEAIQCQKRLLCYPVAGDQFVNCAHIVEKWKIGVRIYGFTRKDVEEGLKRVMEDNGMKCRLKGLYEKTMGEEARLMLMSNFTTFVSDLRKVANETF